MANISYCLKGQLKELPCWQIRTIIGKIDYGKFAIVRICGESSVRMVANRNNAVMKINKKVEFKVADILIYLSAV